MRLRLTKEMIDALVVIETLQSSGYEAVFVGGAVRDAVLGLPIHDIDIATSALPEQTIALFDRCIATGLQHGTVTVVHDGAHYEVTTYRSESQYEQHRKPKEVTFIARLDEDLLRRDFTMNAMAITVNGQLYDPYGGMADLHRSTLRCVGDANLRLQEDALRMMRAVRFLGTYSLTPALSTWRAMKRHRALLRHVAMERIHAELDKMIGSNAPYRPLAWLYASGLLLHVKEKLPIGIEQILRDAHRSFNQDQMADVQNLRQKDERWSAIVLSMGFSEEEVQQLLKALRFPNKRMLFILSIMKLQRTMAQAVEASDGTIDRVWQGCVIQYGEGNAAHWLKVAQTLQGQADRLSAAAAARLQEAMDLMPVKTLKALAVSGGDVQRAVGRASGPWLSAMLNRLLTCTAAGELANEKDELLAQAIKWNDEESKDESG